jgi:hypothetical protein
VPIGHITLGANGTIEIDIYRRSSVRPADALASSLATTPFNKTRRLRVEVLSHVCPDASPQVWRTQVCQISAADSLMDASLRMAEHCVCRSVIKAHDCCE